MKPAALTESQDELNTNTRVIETIIEYCWNHGFHDMVLHREVLPEICNYGNVSRHAEFIRLFTNRPLSDIFKTVGRVCPDFYNPIKPNLS